MASGREVIMGLRIAGAAGYLDAARVVREVDTLDRIVATLYKLAYRSGARADRTRAAEGSPSGLVSSPGRFFASS